MTATGRLREDFDPSDLVLIHTANAAVGEGRGQYVGEALVRGLHRAGGLGVADEPVSGVGVVQGDGDRVGVGVHAVGKDGGDRLFLDPDAPEDKRVRITDDFGQQVQMSEEQFADLVAQAKAGALDRLTAASA